jgi:hypothetical protein
MNTDNLQNDPNQISTANLNSDEISLKELFIKLLEWGGYFLGQWKVILIIGFIGGLLGFLFAINKKPQFVAELTFVLENPQSNAASSYSGLASTLGIDLSSSSSNGAFEGDNLFSLMQSGTMIKTTLLSPIKVNDKLITLAEFYIQIYNLRDKWKDEKYKLTTFLPNSGKDELNLQQNSILKSLHTQIINNNLFVGKKDKKSNLLSIRVISENELFSKLFTEILCEKVSDLYIETKTKKATENVAILQKQVDSLRIVLNSSIRGVAVSLDANPNKNPALQILNVPSQSNQINIQANQVIFGQLLQNLEVSKVSLRKETPLIQIIDEPTFPLEVQTMSWSKWFFIGLLSSSFLTCVALLFKKIIKDNLL